MDNGLIGILIGVIGSVIAGIAQYRNTVLRAKVLRTKDATDKELSQIEQALQSWKDINTVNSSKIKELDNDSKELRRDLDAEQERRHKCEIKLAELQGKIEVLMSVQERQLIMQNTQDQRQTERMDRNDVRQNNSDSRQDSTDTRQDLSDTRQDKNDTRQTARHEQQDDRQDLQDTEVTRIGDELKHVGENGK